MTFTCKSDKPSCDRYLSFQDFGPSDSEYWFGLRETLLPNLGALEGAPSANNFDPLLPSRYAQLMEVVNQAKGGRLVSLSRMMGVGTLITEGEQSGLQSVYKNRDVVFSEVPHPLPRAYAVFEALWVSDSTQALRAITSTGYIPTQTVVLESSVPRPADPSSRLPLLPQPLTATSNSVRIRAALPADGYLVLLDTYYPGWQATVDGHPVEVLAANLAFRAVSVPAGEHLVEFHYRPASFRIGSVVTGGTILLLLAYLAVRWKRN